MKAIQAVIRQDPGKEATITIRPQAGRGTDRRPQRARPVTALPDGLARSPRPVGQAHRHKRPPPRGHVLPLPVIFSESPASAVPALTAARAGELMAVREKLKSKLQSQLRNPSYRKTQLSSWSQRGTSSRATGPNWSERSSQSSTPTTTRARQTPV